MKRQTIKIACSVRRFRPKPPVLTANNVTMSLDWTYDGPPGDGFDIFAHLAGYAPDEFEELDQVSPDKRTYMLRFDDPADAIGYKYYIVPIDNEFNWLTASSNIVNFAAG